MRYCGPFLFAAAIPLLYYLAGPLWPLAAVAALLAALIGAEWLPARWAPLVKGDLRQSRLFPLLYVPLQLGVIVWAIPVAAHATAPAFAALAISVGVSAGVFGMLCAHELVHSRRRFDRLVGLAMLTATSNRQFRISHIHGHHRWAGTERDAASARLGESFYAFLARTLSGQWREAWAFEERRRASRNTGLWHNRAARDIAATVLAYAAVIAAFGLRGGLFFLCQGAIAIVVLELFNYIAHYGLRRPAGEALLDSCSWNSSNAFANLLIFNMGRHSDHHRRPAAAYQVLSEIDHAPELPLGYAGSILLALAPPLWRHVMDPRTAAPAREQGTLPRPR